MAFLAVDLPSKLVERIGQMLGALQEWMMEAMSEDTYKLRSSEAVLVGDA